MRSQLYYIVRKVLGQEQRNQLKLVKYKFKKKSAHLRTRFYGSFNASELHQELKEKIPQDFEILMVHCSLSDMTPMYNGNLSELLQVFVDLCGPHRTLVMPAFFLGDRKYNYNTLAFYQDRPEFLVDQAPSQMGMLSEVFRRYPNVLVSSHPTHRISALGPRAQELIANHELCQTGCGKGSPFDKMTEIKTIAIGSGIRYYQCLTQSHSPEDILIETGEYPTKFHLNKVNLTLKHKDGRELEHRLILPDKSPYQRKIHPMLRKLLKKDEMGEWNFHGVPFFYARAERVQQVLIDAALRGKSVYH